MPPKPPLHTANRRKLLVYGGMAAAILLVVLISRRQSAAAAAAQQGQAMPASNPALDPSSYYSGGSGASGAGGVDYGPQLANLDTDIQTMAQAIAAWQQQQQTPGPASNPVPPPPAPAAPNITVNIPGAYSPPPAAPGPGNRPVAPPPPSIAQRDAPFLAPGAHAPSYLLVPPPGAGSAKWSGPNSPGRNWVGIGGGWWRPK